MLETQPFKRAMLETQTSVETQGQVDTQAFTGIDTEATHEDTIDNQTLSNEDIVGKAMTHEDTIDNQTLSNEDIVGKATTHEGTIDNQTLSNEDIVGKATTHEDTIDNQTLNNDDICKATTHEVDKSVLSNEDIDKQTLSNEDIGKATTHEAACGADAALINIAGAAALPIQLLLAANAAEEAALVALRQLEASLVDMTVMLVPDVAMELAITRELLAAPQRTTRAAAEALIAVGRAAAACPSGPPHEQLAERLVAVETNVRDVTVWRCQLRAPVGNRGKFLTVLKEAFGSAYEDKNLFSQIMHAYRHVVKDTKHEDTIDNQTLNNDDIGKATTHEDTIDKQTLSNEDNIGLPRGLLEGSGSQSDESDNSDDSDAYFYGTVDSLRVP